MLSPTPYQILEKLDGLQEQPGAGSAPFIRLVIWMAVGWLDEEDSKTAWCGCLMAVVFLLSGRRHLVPAECYRAKSWKNVGEMVPASKAQEGDLAIFRRSGGGHVALVSRLAGARIYVRGGNQDNQVNETAYPLTRLEAVRRFS